MFHSFISPVLFLILATLNAAAESNTLSRPVLVSIQGLATTHPDFEKICKIIKDETNSWSLQTQITPTCYNSTQSKDIFIQKLKDPQYGTAIEVLNDIQQNKFKLKISNLQTTENQNDDVEPKSLKWEVEKSDKGLIGLVKLLRQYSDFDAAKKDIKRDLLSQALNTDISIKDFSDTYNQFISSKEENKRYMVAGLEIAAMLGLATYHYYSSQGDDNPNSRDWDYLKFKDSMKARFTGHMEGVRFDDNRYLINRDHLWAGTMYYTAARSAGLSRLESLLLTMASSSLWEYLSEYREVVSLNDQIFTSYGGFILGESLHQVGKIFKKGSNKGLNRILKEIFGGPEKFSQWLDHKVKGRRNTEISVVSENMDFWSKLDIYAQIDKDQSHQSLGYGFHAIVIDIPQFEESGYAQKILADTVFAELLFQMNPENGAENFRMFAKTTLGAYYEKNMGKNAKNQLEGYQFFIGPSSAVEINQTMNGNSFRSDGSDFQAVVHVLGSTLDVTAYHNGYILRFTMDVYGDFGLIRSWTFDHATNGRFIGKYHKEDSSGFQSILRNDGSYFAAGATGSVNITLAQGPFEVGLAAEQSHFLQIKKRGRYKNEKVDAGVSDQIGKVRIWLAYEFSPSFKIELGVNVKQKVSSALETKIKTSETIPYGRLVYKY
jgi:biopolymer transport protein ExbD